MIPGLLAQDIAKSLREFIVTGFETDTWPFAGKFEEFVNDHKNGEAFIKGPYVSIGLPFLKTTSSRDFFAGFKTEHSPFAHQHEAWRNLSSFGKPRSTLVATGTGSGKTECFLYPLLDHCQRNPAKGIKAIVIYPMNALATDQSRRFASVINKTPDLTGKIRVGLFIGGAERTEQTSMSPLDVITCKKTLRDNPPDILLTNYKMLDYLLMRPKDQPLWSNNNLDTLRYLIVDELHTFDGAQGADLGMLIRRLKARLQVPDKQLICAGTSATLGSEGQMDDLAKFASDIFDTPFDRYSIIGEKREANDAFLDAMDFSLLLNPGFTPEQLHPEYYKTQQDYLTSQAKLFFGEDNQIDISTNKGRQALGKLLKSSPYLHSLLHYLTKNGISPLQQLAKAIQKQLPGNLSNHASEVLLSLLSLLAHARGSNYESEPFVTARLQLWARELRRIVARVGDDSPQAPVNLHFFDDIKTGQGSIFLPMVQCNECHSTAWLARQEDNCSHIDQDLRSTYNAFFSQDKSVRILLPVENRQSQFSVRGIHRHICSSCGFLQTENGHCQSCQESALVPVFQPDLNTEVNRGGVRKLESQRNCPVCQANSSLLLFGARAASLSSVAIHQLYSNPVNDDKKLIAFSDSVQDAAHRAGFFAARTWQNNIRMAFARTLYAESTPIPLVDFSKKVTHFWTDDPNNPDRLSELEYITQFIPPNLQASEDWLKLKENDSIDNPSAIINLINQRLKWEVMLEFGLKSSIGRSLQRTGVSTLGWEPELINEGAVELVQRAKEQVGIALDQDKAAHILWGIAIRMKRQGAIFDPIVNGYIHSGGNWFMLSHKKLTFMPVSGSHFVQPRFPAEAAERNMDPVVSKGNQGWYLRWVTMILGAEQLTGDASALKELCLLAMKALVSSDLVTEHETQKGNTVWALNPEKLYLYQKTASFQLSRKNHNGDDTGKLQSLGNWVVPELWEESIGGLPSMDRAGSQIQESAVYLKNLSPRQSFYKNYYLYGQIQRVLAHEHTALLERHFREDLENRFINGKHPWDTNLLSATPTLEMGIDIGDLSSVLLCSVPPSQANYLQRAGRGGRRDGNSFVLTLANGHPHDLFFYSDPLKMIAGDVEAPAIFLNASMVLRRQLLAFCFDQWGMKEQGKQVIPGSMQPVLDAVKSRSLGKFPYTLIDFIQKYRDQLWDDFESLLDEQITDTCRNRLHKIMLGTSEEDDPLDLYFLNAIKKRVDLCQSLFEHQKSLESHLKKLKKKPQDEATVAEIRTHDAELDGIKRLKYELNKKETFNFFTDEGLLPNYAFPEEGTTLRSVIYRKLSTPRQNKDGSTTSFDSRTFEYIRPAHAALSELAPESIFYASNRKVQIQRIEMAKGKNLEHWRLCPSCSYSEKIEGLESPLCPRCEEPMWANVSQKRPMLRLQQVYANTSEEEAQLGDDSDTREPIFFNRQMLIDFNRQDIEHAYALDSDQASFGFEFIRKVNFREINFGKQGGSDQVFHVAGRELARPGFRVCKECGFVQYRRQQPEHLFKCQYRNSEGNEGIIDCLYLYREYHSEAIRILMPNLFSVARDEQSESFVAAIQLGLKKRFGGKVDHIHITLDDEPIPGSTERANYLVLYDSVPGGTGYLHELLAQPENLIEVLKLAKQVLLECQCQHNEDEDGCYSCLYAYKNSYGMERTSRKTALEMLAAVLDGEDSLKTIEHLGKIKKDPWVDSELEAHFPGAIQSLNNHALLDNIRIRVSKDIINGKQGFRLEVGEYNYSVEIHAGLADQDGAAYPCEPDFLITSDRESLGLKPIAVFLDGWKYHKDCIQEDLLKRQGLTLQGKYLCWSLTWHDLQHAYAGNETKIPNPLKEHTNNSPAAVIQQIAVRHHLTDQAKWAELPPLFQLLKFLARPELEKWSQFATIRHICWLDQQNMQSEDLMSAFRTLVKQHPAQFLDCWADKPLKLVQRLEFGDEQNALTLGCAMEHGAIASLDSQCVVSTLIYNVADQASQEAHTLWQKLLQLLNLNQFINCSFATTAKGLETGSYSQLCWGQTDESIDTSDWDDIFELAEDDVHELVHQLVEKDTHKPEVAYEHITEKGKVVAEAELAWPELQVALLLDFQIEENQSKFDKLGWTVMTLQTAMDDIIQRVGKQ